MNPTEKEINYLLERGFIKGWNAAAEAMEKIGCPIEAMILRSGIEPREKKHMAMKTAHDEADNAE